jgi:hypothetical protein
MVGIGRQLMLCSLLESYCATNCSRLIESQFLVACVGPHFVGDLLCHELSQTSWATVCCSTYWATFLLATYRVANCLRNLVPQTVVARRGPHFVADLSCRELFEPYRATVCGSTPYATFCWRLIVPRIG